MSERCSSPDEKMNTKVLPFSRWEGRTVRWTTTQRQVVQRLSTRKRRQRDRLVAIEGIES